ncbi:DUF222 domain-containing protein [Geodermatophilus sp. SYSU D01045]
MASWLRGHCRLSRGEASRLVRNGRALEHLPVLAEAHDAGLVSAEQVAVTADVTTPARRAATATQGVDLGEIDAILTAVAMEQEHDALVVVVQRYCDALDPDGPEPDPTEGRSLTLSKHADGSVSGRFHLDAVGGEKVQTALEAHVQADRPAGDERCRAQRLGDAVVQLADNALASGGVPVLRGVKPQVVVEVDAGDLAAGQGSAELGSGALVSAARARWLACDGAIARVVMGPGGVPLDVGRDHRLATRGIRRAAEVRDGGCVFTGCDAPTWWCDVHHHVHWLDGGETSLENSALLCERHHTKVHHGFRIERQPGGGWRTWRPDGTEITVPAPLRRPPLVPAA